VAFRHRSAGIPLTSETTVTHAGHSSSSIPRSSGVNNVQRLGRQLRTSQEEYRRLEKHVSKNVIIRRNLHDQSICTSAQATILCLSPREPIRASCGRKGVLRRESRLTYQPHHTGRQGTSLLELVSSALGEDSFAPTSVD